MRSLLHTFVRDEFLRSVRALSVAFIYEDAETHDRATAVYEFLVQELDETAELNATWWRTSLVGDPKLSRAAARAISGSDLIVFSVHTDSQPLLATKNWLESWLLQGGHPIKLVALLPGSGEQSVEQSEWDAYLRDFAMRHGVLYLPGPLAWTIESTTESMGQDRERGGGMQAELPDRPIEPYVHWGLNE